MMKCTKAKSIQREFIKETYQDLKKINDGYVNEKEILEILEDIAIFFEGGDPKEYEMTQHYVGMSSLFRGFVVKDWKGVDFNCLKYRRFKKVLVVKAVMFYNKYWKQRNDFYHNAEK